MIAYSNGHKPVAGAEVLDNGLGFESPYQIDVSAMLLSARNGQRTGAKHG